MRNQIPAGASPGWSFAPAVAAVLALGALALALGVVSLPLGVVAPATGGEGDDARTKTARVKPTEDFEVTGDGSTPAWGKAEWLELRRRSPGALPYDARFKTLYSKTGLYVLFDGKDSELTSRMAEDYLDLWKEDVYEVFLWTDERHPVYFEYEISPLARELPILVPNLEGTFLGWRPWHYEGSRKTRKATAAIGGAKEPGAKVEGWRAEIFIPYELLSPLQNVPPKPGARWRANFYRMDHDGGKTTGWDWAPVGSSFHEFKSFGTLIFEA